MKNLFEIINVSTNENSAAGAYASISYSEWSDGETCNLIHDALDGIGINVDGCNMYFEGVDVIENALNSAHEGETVFFWID